MELKIISAQNGFMVFADWGGGTKIDSYVAKDKEELKAMLDKVLIEADEAPLGKRRKS